MLMPTTANANATAKSLGRRQRSRSMERNEASKRQASVCAGRQVMVAVGIGAVAVEQAANFLSAICCCCCCCFGSLCVCGKEANEWRPDADAAVHSSSRFVASFLKVALRSHIFSPFSLFFFYSIQTLTRLKKKSERNSLSSQRIKLKQSKAKQQLFTLSSFSPFFSLLFLPLHCNQRTNQPTNQHTHINTTTRRLTLTPQWLFSNSLSPCSSARKKPNYNKR